ncbi:hypothetical protein HKX48_005260 [Thoreauomyces humboldtii]|nr:hypothetical protein HKX48_005260 [Thoreauomyces humboldtii]
MSHALVYGGGGALGRAIVGHLRKSNWKVTSVDFTSNNDATNNVVLNMNASTASLETTGRDVEAQVAKVLGSESGKLGVVVNAAGGWAGGNLADDAFYSNVSLMISQSVNSSVISARLASKHLKECVRKTFRAFGTC